MRWIEHAAEVKDCGRDCVHLGDALRLSDSVTVRIGLASVVPPEGLEPPTRGLGKPVLLSRGAPSASASVHNADGIGHRGPRFAAAACSVCGQDCGQAYVAVSRNFTPQARDHSIICCLVYGK